MNKLKKSGKCWKNFIPGLRLYTFGYETIAERRITLKELIEKTYNDYMQYYVKAKTFLETAPTGRLSLHRKNGHVYYYQKMSDGTVRYLNKKDQALISTLAQKSYYEKITKNLSGKMSLLKLLLQSYETDIDDIYEGLSEEKRNIVIPIKPTYRQKIEIWQNEQVNPYNEYPEALRFHTQRGELVRSKSELMIADYLYKHADVLDYRYEQELTLSNQREIITIHPDFKIFNLKTGQIFYWEHAGKMDDMKYVNGFMRKIALYSSNEFIIGKDVIITFEDSSHPLDTLQIRQALRIILGE